MATTGQTINDRLNAVRYALAGQGLARTVCKATTEEVLGPKKKHMDYLLACTEEPNVSIPDLANLLIDRTQHTSWAVVFKSLITIHHLLNYGNERFTQYLATSNHSFELNDFMDRTTPQGYNMSTFVRRYAKYVNDKIVSYRTLAIDLCKIKPGKDNALRTMNMENLTKTLPVVHSQFDSLLDFDVEAKDLNNGVIMAAFKLLYKDLNRIFAAYQEAIINLVERYFNLSRKKAREALAMYKKYLARMDKVANFFKVVEQAGLDKNELPDTSKLTSLLGVFEAHLAQLEAKKRGTTPSSPPGEAAEDDEKTDASSNKENTKPEQAAAPKKPGASPTPSQESGRKSPGVSKQVESPSSSGQKAATASAPAKKQPPARPSPIVSPKVSPSKPKSPAKNQAAEAAVAPEKKAPPERPAKPPSRPPPPTATAPASSASTSAPATSSPPPHPPPPHPQPPTQRIPSPSVVEPEPAASDEPTAEAPSAAHYDDNGSTETAPVDGSNHSADGRADPSAEQPDASNGPACSGSSAVTNEVGRSTAQIGPNHVATNDIENNHVDGLPNGTEPPPPPPPPPIDDASSTNEAAANESDDGVVQEVQSTQDDDPGSSQEGAAPPPPPPIED